VFKNKLLLVDICEHGKHIWITALDNDIRGINVHTRNGNVSCFVCTDENKVMCQEINRTEHMNLVIK